MPIISNLLNTPLDVPDPREWIQNTGHENPPYLGHRVDVKHRNGRVYLNVISGTNYATSFTLDGNHSDIMEYRLSDVPEGTGTTGFRLEQRLVAMRDILDFAGEYEARSVKREKTPYEKKGYLPEDIFIVKEGADVPEGSFVKLERDDGTRMPRFRLKEGSGIHKCTYILLDDVKKIDISEEWALREVNRAMNLYRSVPPAVIKKMKGLGYVPDIRHFLHVADSDISKIAYTENPKKGDLDRQTVTTIGRYIKKYSDLSDPDIALISNLYRKIVMDDQEIKFARTREEIRRVYENGPSSCMSHDIDYYSTDGVHPSEVYATESVSVAYMERVNSDGSTRITARTVCNEISKYFVRFYGDEDTMYPIMKSMGYSSGDLEGCSLLRIDVKGTVVCPYLDGGCDRVDIGETHLEIQSDGVHCADSERGVLEQPSVCGHCDERHDSEEYHSAHHDIEIGECCIDQYTYAITGRLRGDWFLSGEVEYYEYDYDNYTTDGLSAHNLVLFEGEVYNEDDMIYSELDQEYYPDNYDLIHFSVKHGGRDCTHLYQDDIHSVEEGLYHVDDLYEIEVDGEMQYTLEKPEEGDVA